MRNLEGLKVILESLLDENEAVLNDICELMQVETQELKPEQKRAFSAKVEAFLKDKKTIKRELLNKFRAISPDRGYTLSPYWLEFCYLNHLHGKEKVLFEKAVQELVVQGLLEGMPEPGQYLKLTDKGVDLIS